MQWLLLLTWSNFISREIFLHPIMCSVKSCTAIHTPFLSANKHKMSLLWYQGQITVVSTRFGNQTFPKINPFSALSWDLCQSDFAVIPVQFQTMGFMTSWKGIIQSFQETAPLWGNQNHFTDIWWCQLVKNKQPKAILQLQEIRENFFYISSVYDWAFFSLSWSCTWQNFSRYLQIIKTIYNRDFKNVKTSHIVFWL